MPIIIKRYFYTIINFLGSLNQYKFIFLVSLCTLTISLIVGYIYRITEFNLGIDPSIGSDLFSTSNVTEIFNSFLITVVFAPLWETFIYHFLLILLLIKIVKLDYLVVLFSAMIFSYGHLENSLLNMISTFFTGLFLAYSFLHWYKKSNSKKIGFEAALGVHALHNLYYSLLSFVPASVIF